MPSPQKQKGSSFEREVAKFLTETYGETFIRAPGSGAYVGGINQQRKQYLHEGQIRSFKGDIVPGQSFSKLNVECKSYADLAFHLLLTGSKQLDGWLEQLMTVAEVDDFNILFMKFNRKGRYVAVQSHLFWDRSPAHTVYHSATTGTWLIFDFTQYFNYNTQLFKTYSNTGTRSTGTADTTSTPDSIVLA